MKSAVLISLLILVCCFEAKAECWSPENEKSIVDAFKPIAKYHETPAVVSQIHDLIWSHRDLIDPRLVYHRIMGESYADPDGTNALARMHITIPKDTSAFGMFMYTGKPYQPGVKDKKTYKQELIARWAAQPHISRRLLDVEYYYERIITPFIEAANHHQGCAREKVWSQYSTLEKAAFVNWGSCNSQTLTRERQLCVSNVGYRTNACPFSKDLLLGKHVLPVCDRSRSSHAPSSRRAAGSVE